MPSRPLDFETGFKQYVNLIIHAPKKSTIVWHEGQKPYLIPYKKRQKNK